MNGENEFNANDFDDNLNRENDKNSQSIVEFSEHSSDIPDLSSLPLYEKVKAACTYILENNNKRNSDETMMSNELFEKVKETFPDHFSAGFSKNTFYQYLSNSVGDENSFINCLGRRQGYYISNVAREVINKLRHEEDTTELDSEKSDKPEVRSRAQREKLLYPYLEAWLISLGYRAEDISTGKALGKWGNPDVAGISGVDFLNGSSLELVTIEAKATVEDWEKWIFEAVSHRRFANRSYFAFAAPDDMANKVPADMRYYSELFGVGVLMLCFDNNAFKNYLNGDLTDFENETCSVREIFSAPFHFVQPRYQAEFCKVNGIDGIKKLYTWGRGDEENKK